MSWSIDRIEYEEDYCFPISYYNSNIMWPESEQ